MSARRFPSEAELDGVLTGPDSVSWRRASDVRLHAVMLYPLLLQVAHPTVGAGVSDYSDFEQRPWDRFMRTIDYVSLLVYGGREAAAAGRRLRELHRGFKGVREDGEPYHALEPEAYAWVHATLIETYVAGHAHFGKPMRPDQIERFYCEYRGLGRLIGVREGDLPDTWTGFRAYFEDMVSQHLVRTAACDQVLGAVRDAPPPPIPIPHPLWRLLRLPAGQVLWLGGVGLMSADLRDRLAIRWRGTDEAQFRLMGALSRSLTPVLPRSLRITGPAQLRWRREEIAQGPLGA
ncbi:MAG: oxygenase MpaB family protein [Solirubrobacteraceae bacterium]